VTDTNRTNEPAAKPVIFADQDVPCPRCGYNLRGLVEPRCPECGLVFDPERVRRESRQRQTEPGLGWMLARMIPHPIRFWEPPSVREAKPPSPLHVAAFAGLGAGVVPILLLVLFAIHDGDILGWSAVLAALWAAMTVATTAMAGVHELFCRQVLGRAQARKVVRYPAAWLVVAIPSMTTCMWMLLRTGSDRAFGPRGAPSSPDIWLWGISTLGIVATLASCLAWAIALYTGARGLSNARAPAAWCVLCNPFWYVSGLVLVLLAACLTIWCSW
jgi:hypothetical protein